MLTDSDLAVMVVSLMLMDEVLFKSRYEPELQNIISERIKWLLDYIERRRQYPE